MSRDRSIGLVVALALALAFAAGEAGLAQSKGKGNGNGNGNGGGGGATCDVSEATPPTFAAPVMVDDPAGEQQSMFGRQVRGQYVSVVDGIPVDRIVIAATDNHDGVNGGAGAVHFYEVDPSVGSVTGPVDSVPSSLTNGGNLRAANLNNDGIPDFIGGHSTDEVVDLYVSQGGLPLQWDRVAVLEPPPDTRSFGSGVDPGDIDGDGIDEFVVGARGARFKKKGKWQVVPGRAFVYDYDPQMEAVSLLQQIDYWETTDDRFGDSVALGDVQDTPGLELIVAARDADTVNGDEGAVFVFQWLADQFDPSPVATMTGSNPGDSLGREVTTALVSSSVDGEALLASTTGNTADDRAEVFFHNFAALPLPDRVLRPSGNSKEWSTVGIPTGDIDGDGFDDVLVAAPAAVCGNLTNVGTAFLFLGEVEAPSEVFLPPTVDTKDDWHAYGRGSAIISSPLGRFVVIGEPGRNSNSGRIYVYRWIGA